MKRTIFIGDIQWCYDEYKALLKKLEITENDTVYLVGDMISRGPKSYKVLKHLYKHRSQFHAVKWNHEVNFLRWLENWWDYQDNTSFIELKNKIEEKDKQKYIDYLKELPLYIETDDFIVLHAWKYPDKELSDHDIDEITRVREINNTPWYKLYTDDKKIIYWHWAVDGLRKRKNTIWLDTGCVYGKTLTAYILETDEIIQQQALDIYHNVYEDRWDKEKK